MPVEPSFDKMMDELVRLTKKVEGMEECLKDIPGANYHTYEEGGEDYNGRGVVQEKFSVG